jgi:YYY domain-containing protein
LLQPLLIWLLTLVLLGWVQFPLCFRIGRPLRDRGLALSKLAGVFVPTYVAWLLAHVGVPHTQGAIIPLIVALAAANALLVPRDWPDYRRFFRRHWPYVLVLEALFISGFLALAWVRAQIPAVAFDPNWWGAEKWSDYALLSSLSRQTQFPPLDSWCAGLTINYYYFGHLAWATLTKITALPPNVSYNLALASVAALALAACLGLGYHLFRSIGLGLLLAFLVVIGGNFKPVLQLLNNYLVNERLEAAAAAAPETAVRLRPVGHIDFWNASREMDWGPAGEINGGEINEFPSFSFVLGDLHPHFSAHPVFLGFLLILAALWRAGRRHTFSAHRVLLDRLPLWLALAFVIGLLYATNSWDALVALFLAAVVLPFARGFRAWPGYARVILAAMILMLGYVVGIRVLFLPFDLHFVPPQSIGVGVNSPVQVVPVELRTTLTEWLFYFGLFLVPFTIWVLWDAASKRWTAVAATALVGAFAVLSWATKSQSVPAPLRLILLVVSGMVLVGFALAATWLLWDIIAARPQTPTDQRAAILAAAFAAGVAMTVEGQSPLIGLLAFGMVAFMPTIFRPRQRFNLEFISILAWLAVLVSWLCEWFYYNDAFAGENERINTIFKVYYALWPVTALAAVGACSGLWGRRRARRRGLRRVAALVMIAVLLAISSLYPLFAWTTRIGDYRESIIGENQPPTLDGLAYLTLLPGFSDDYYAARWLRTKLPPDVVIAETYDWGYSYASRFATIGGISCLVGWSQHETVWREGYGYELIAGRQKAIDDLFTTTSAPVALGILRAWNIDYVAVGWLERQRYGAEALAKFDAIGSPVFTSGTTTVYVIPEDTVPRIIQIDETEGAKP